MIFGDLHFIVAVFLSLCSLTFWGHTHCYCGCALVHCRVFSSIISLYPLDANMSHDNQKKVPDVA